MSSFLSFVWQTHIYFQFNVNSNVEVLIAGSLLEHDVSAESKVHEG